MVADGRLKGRVAVVTGGTGVLGSAIAIGAAEAGASVGVLGRNRERADLVVDAIRSAGGTAMVLIADVLHSDELKRARDCVEEEWGHVDILINAAGGHVQAALTTPERSFFEITEEALRAVIELNLMGTILPSQIFGMSMASATPGGSSASIVNVSSMAADRAITRVVGYGVAKAGVNNLTRWMASDLAGLARPIRVNAIAPGFFIAETNQTLLVNGDELTDRGKLIIERTPAGRFGRPGELVGTALWLASEDSAFVTGTVIPVDGGFSTFSGV